MFHYIYHILIMHLSVDKHEGSFHILAIMINTTVNMGMSLSQCLFETLILFILDTYSEVGLLDQYGSYIINFFRKLHTVSHKGCTKMNEAGGHYAK